ncbi:MAG: iron-sulfur cluster carrier protein ApbC [Geminicoccaceae bacterium]|nr:iron-sulfur cluster carrier protein ApbC [Geminicoccaceae bacterium]
MTAPDREQILEALKAVRHPTKGGDLVGLGMVSGVVVKGGNVGFALEVDPAEAKALEPLRQAAEAAVKRLPGVLSVAVVLTAERAPGGRMPSGQAAPPPEIGARAPQKPLVPGIDAIVAVGSGKGGVGKSTTAINLAMGLAALGVRTGLLDADIYGPSLPRMSGLSGRPTTVDGKRLRPMEAFGVKLMSMGFLVEEDTAMIWRGPMVQSALRQMLADVDWGRLDVLVVDLPPGTGDAQLTMAQHVPLAGAVIVSTPQDIALLDAKKAINMFRRVDVPVLGIVENMSYYRCPNCGHRADIFAHGGARETAARFGVDFLAEIPLAIEIRETSDAGRPIVVSAPDHPQAKAYLDLARTVRDKLSPEAQSRRAFPGIVYE